VKRRTFILAAALLLALAALVVGILSVQTTPRAQTPLTHEVYLWQRAWTGPVREAIQQHGSNFLSLAALQAEVSWQNNQPRLARVAIDYPVLQQAGPRIALVLRIAPYAGPFADGDPTCVWLADVAATLLTEARAHQISPMELQIDFDCAASKLEGYRLWLAAIQQRANPTPVTITALPSWLRSPAFKPLAQRATNYILQVHSLARPADYSAPFTLCDPAAAQRAVERAARIGVPFRVALPTYGYITAFDRAGQFIGLSAEGPARAWPEGARLRDVRADPLELAVLIQTWAASRPAAMRGVIWYRLPVAADTLNWRWPTLNALLQTRSPLEHIRAAPRRTAAGRVEIDLVNDGELDISPPLAVEVRWPADSGTRLMAGGAAGDFELTRSGGSSARFRAASQFHRVPAGDKLTVGWLRFDRDCDLRLDLQRN